MDPNNISRTRGTTLVDVYVDLILLMLEYDSVAPKIKFLRKYLFPPNFEFVSVTVVYLQFLFANSSVTPLLNLKPNLRRKHVFYRRVI